MHRLLVPIDGSDCSLRALRHALDRGREGCGIELVLVHAHEAPAIYGEVEIYLSRERAEELQHQHSEALLKPAVDLIRASGRRAKTEIRIGSVAHEIVRCGEENACDGIVMGSRGMGAIGNLLLGSVATKVVHLAKVPVTLVK